MVPTHDTCVACSVLVPRRTPKSRRRYCDPCRQEALRISRIESTNRRRAWKVRAPTENIDICIVYAACRWTCGVCGLPVEPAASKPDLDRASLDHIIPLSKGGHHTYDNVQLAHLRCNVRKHARI